MKQGINETKHAISNRSKLNHIKNQSKSKLEKIKKWKHEQEIKQQHTTQHQTETNYNISQINTNQTIVQSSNGKKRNQNATVQHRTETNQITSKIKTNQHVKQKTTHANENENKTKTNNTTSNRNKLKHIKIKTNQQLNNMNK